MAEFCEQCLIRIFGLTKSKAKQLVSNYKDNEKDLCEGCGKFVVMKNNKKEGD